MQSEASALDHLPVAMEMLARVGLVILLVIFMLLNRRELRDRISGLAQPQYVIDIPGGVSKALASPSDVQADDGQVRLRGRDGVWREH